MWPTHDAVRCSRVGRTHRDESAGLHAVARHKKGQSAQHSTATHLLSSGVEINTVRAWLGHASLETTKMYAEINLDGKARALAKCEVIAGEARSRRRHTDPNIMQFLKSL